MVSIGILEKKSDCLGYLQKYLSKKKKKSEVKKKKKKECIWGLEGQMAHQEG
jgi:hypothetical protein